MSILLNIPPNKKLSPDEAAKFKNEWNVSDLRFCYVITQGPLEEGYHKITLTEAENGEPVPAPNPKKLCFYSPTRI